MGNPLIDAIKNAALTLIPGGAGVSVGESAATATGSKSAISDAQSEAGKAAKSVANAAGNATGLGSVGTDISSVAGFTSALGNKTLWVRVAKVTIGGSLLLIGLAHLSGADKAVGGVAGKVLKAAPLL